ncbi:MAG: peptide chain release factor N(5)-glutamine methyltransferase [Bacteroidota bacterium]|nr:peptide chain release factor N(5)-glutamine methyltransferase [Bacteroidota bacterium]
MKQEPIYHNFLSVLEEKLSILPDKSEETAENTLRALWLTASGRCVSPIAAEKMELPVLTEAQITQLEEFIQHRIKGVPLAHITERQNFMNMDLILSSVNYIPRKDTELLAKAAIETIMEEFQHEQKVIVIDLCTGIGTVALAIAQNSKNAHVYGSDIHPPAIESANINARYFSLTERTTFFNADMFQPFEALALKEKTDIIVSAPPYISTERVKNMAPEIALHEPKEAFDAGPLGLSIFNSLINTAPEYLNTNGYLIFECGQGQGEFLASRIENSGHFGKVIRINDEKGNVRVLKAKKVS